MSTLWTAPPESLAPALARLDATSRALLELAMRHRLSPTAIAPVLGTDAAAVVQLREAALAQVAATIACEDVELVRSWLIDLPAEEWETAALRGPTAPVRRFTPRAPAARPQLSRPPRVRRRRARPDVVRRGSRPASARRRPARRRAWLGRAAAALVALAAVTAVVFGLISHGSRARSARSVVAAVPVKTVDRGNRLSGMPAPLDPHDAYAADRAGSLSPVVRKDPPRIYVPNTESNTVDVIDPATYKVVAHFPVGALPQHVVPSYDLKTLWVANDYGNTLTRIDPASGRPGRSVPVADPYNLYFTPDGRYAIVVAEALGRLDFRDADSMRLHRSLSVPCAGVDHMDFTADGRFLLASCEFGSRMLVVDVARERVAGAIPLPSGGMPQDVKLSPDGRVFYVADMTANGLWLIDAHTFRKLGFVATGRGAHGLYVSRDSRYLYVSNRGEGTISVVSFARQSVVKRWRIPGGGSPDMGGVSADGRVLWLTGRYNAEVYAINTGTGALLARIPVGNGPHGLCVYPQPGRYSLGHTGVFR
jgi:YVTN family beta-propeller protein